MSADANTNYSDGNNSRENYSPTKRIPSLRDSDIIRNHGLVGSAQRIRGRSRSPIRKFKVLNKTKMANFSPGSADSISVPLLSGPLSPVRRSGSPERRQYISEIESNISRKRQNIQDHDIPKRSKNVTFTNKTEPQDIAEVPTPATKEINNVMNVDEDFVRTFNNFMDTINKRLDRMESVQHQILNKLNKHNDLQDNDNGGNDS